MYDIHTHTADSTSAHQDSTWMYSSTFVHQHDNQYIHTPWVIPPETERHVSHKLRKNLKADYGWIQKEYGLEDDITQIKFPAGYPQSAPKNFGFDVPMTLVTMSERRETLMSELLDKLGKSIADLGYLFVTHDDATERIDIRIGPSKELIEWSELMKQPVPGYEEENNYINVGALGIGTTNPNYGLSISSNGSAYFTGSITANSGTYTANKTTT